jgi:hypothetical protein
LPVITNTQRPAGGLTLGDEAVERSARLFLRLTMQIDLRLGCDQPAPQSYQRALVEARRRAVDEFSRDRCRHRPRRGHFPDRFGRPTLLRGKRGERFGCSISLRRRRGDRPHVGDSPPPEVGFVALEPSPVRPLAAPVAISGRPH